MRGHHLTGFLIKNIYAKTILTTISVVRLLSGCCQIKWSYIRLIYTRNIGSLIRSAVSFNIDGVIIKERNFPSESKLMYKAASGAIEYINIFEVSNINSTLKNLKEKNFWVYGFDGDGKEDFTDIEWKGNNILLFGSEGSGMHKHTSKYADFLVKIRINEKIESLNISNSAAIVFHHLSYLKKKS